MKRYAPFLVLLAGILWGCIGIFVRLLNVGELFAMNIVALRAFLTSGLMGLFLLFYDRRLFVIRIRDLWCFLGTGICSIVFFNFCYFKAIGEMSMAIAAVLLYTAPAMVMVMSYFLFQEKLTRRKILSLVLTFLGCVLVTGVITEPGNITGTGILIGLGAGFGYALYSIFSRFAIERGYHTFTITFYTFLFASVGTVFTSDLPGIVTKASSDPHLFFSGLALALFCTVIPYLTYTLGLKYVDNSTASILASIEPVTAALIGILLYQERISFFGVSGIIIVILALIINH